MKQFTFSVIHAHKDGPFPIELFGSAIPNVVVDEVLIDQATTKYVFTVAHADEENPYEWAFHIGRAIQEKRHVILMKEYIDNHLRDNSN